MEEGAVGGPRVSKLVNLLRRSAVLEIQG